MKAKNLSIFEQYKDILRYKDQYLGPISGLKFELVGSEL